LRPRSPATTDRTQFNAAITRMNDTKSKALDLCDKWY
jgi:hypothetical protein